MLSSLQFNLYFLFAWVFARIREKVRPRARSVTSGFLLDMPLPRTQLMVENAMLRQQVIILQRQIERPALNNADRRFLVIFSSQVQNWKSALLLVQPETLLKWHRELFRFVWKRRSKARNSEAGIDKATIALIHRMAKENSLWGAERIRGELLKLNIRLSKRTVQKYMASVRDKTGNSSRQQKWTSFVNNHADEIWACDFVQTYNLLFQTIFVFFIIEIGSRRVVHFNVTRHPTDAWVSQQLREATPFDTHPRFLIRDNDRKFGKQFERVAKGASIEILRTPIRAPKANAHCERFIGSFRRECLNHIIVLSDRHLRKVTQEYVNYFNLARPHQGIAQRIPDEPPENSCKSIVGKIEAHPVLNGLHHDYRRVS